MIILNERVYAENCLATGEIDKKPFITLQILAKYYYHCLGYRRKRISKLLTEFLSKNYSLYRTNVDSWGETIDKIALKAGKFPLYEIDSVNITKAELDAIDSLKYSKNVKQVAFTLLCLAKLSNLKNESNNGWVNTEAKDVFKMAHVATSAKRQDEIIGDLGVAGYIEFPKKNDNLSNRVTIINDDSEVALVVSDFRELGYLYLKHLGENIIECASCHVLTRGNKCNTKKYCSNCAGYIPIETKVINCVDCGEEVKIPAKNTKTCRCKTCTLIRRKYTKMVYQKEQK